MSSVARAISVDEIVRALDYNPSCGSFTWKPRPDSDFATQRAASIYRTRFEGRPALTCIGANGYQEGRIKGVQVTGHRVAFVIMNGDWPESQVDHINGNRSDNRWSNLRPADQSVNNRNSALRSDSTSGRVGVSFDRARGKWVAQGRVKGTQFNLGRFPTRREAIEVRAKFEREHDFHPNHGRVA